MAPAPIPRLERARTTGVRERFGPSCRAEVEASRATSARWPRRGSGTRSARRCRERGTAAPIVTSPLLYPLPARAGRGRTVGSCRDPPRSRGARTNSWLVPWPSPLARGEDEQLAHAVTLSQLARRSRGARTNSWLMPWPSRCRRD